MKVCVLGGGGCFGLNLARYLHSQQIECFGIGRTGPKPPAFWLAPQGYRFWAYHTLYDLEYIDRLLDEEKPDVIVNFAAQGEGAASFGHDCWRFYATNVVSLVRLVEAIRKKQWLKRFIHIGTSELYGSVDKPSKESDSLRPTSPYSISKAAFDLHLEAMHKIHGFPINIIRPSNCYTPGQQLYRIIPKAIICALSKKKLPLHGGGKAHKSYLHADDLSKAVHAVIHTAPIGKIYNCGPTAPLMIRTIVETCAEACGISFEELVEETPDRVGQDAKYWLDSSALAKDTLWTPTVGFARGIDEMVRWVKTYPELLNADTIFRMRS